MKLINLNADVGEGFGAYDIGDDDAMLGIVRSANIACGFHAGDPLVMRRVVERAKAGGVSIGAHPGFNDLWGFGRRRIEMPAAEVESMVAYQIGALQALAALAGERVTHVKPHGALNNMAAESAELALAIGRAIKVVDRELIYVAPTGSAMERAALELGLKLAREGFCDRQVEDDGSLTPRRIPGAVIHDPALAVERVARMVLDGEMVSRHGKRIACRVDTLCVHGDEPSAVALAAAVRQRLEAAGVRIVPLTEMPLA